MVNCPRTAAGTLFSTSPFGECSGLLQLFRQASLKKGSQSFSFFWFELFSDFLGQFFRSILAKFNNGFPDFYSDFFP